MYFAGKNTQKGLQGLLPSDWAEKHKIFLHHSKARTAATVWNWSVKRLSPRALLPVLYFSRAIFSHLFRLSLAPTICPWVSEDDLPFVKNN